jgi:hypothetical protein
MACALVWSLQKSDDEQSEEFKKVLVRLSGKRLKRGRSPTTGILLSGLFVLLRMLDFLTEIDCDLTKIDKLKTNLDKCIKEGIKNV